MERASWRPWGHRSRLRLICLHGERGNVDGRRSAHGRGARRIGGIERPFQTECCRVRLGSPMTPVADI